MDEHPKLLIVEDEILYAYYLKERLSNEDIIICDIAKTGEDAIASNDRHHPDVILMDVKLSGPMNGVDVARCILKKSDVRIIFMSGYDLNDVKEDARDLYAVSFLEKPITIKDITQALAIV